jgi:hypothetical protein
MSHLANAAKRKLGGGPRPKAGVGPGAAAEQQRRRTSPRALQTTEQKGDDDDDDDDDGDDDAKARRAQRLVMTRGNSIMDRAMALSGSRSDAARGGLLARFKQEEANKWLSIALEYDRGSHKSGGPLTRQASDGEEEEGGDAPPPPPPLPRTPGSPAVPPHHVTPEELVALRVRFDEADEVGSGGLSFDEVREQRGVGLGYRGASSAASSQPQSGSPIAAPSQPHRSPIGAPSGL